MSTGEQPQRLQKSLDLPSAWGSYSDCRVIAWGVDAAPPPALTGRCALSIDCGAAYFSVNPTPDQMRAIAALLIEAADTAGAA